MLDSYTARLSAADHFNSNGARLNSAAAIIRQDRANFYVYGSDDPEDEADAFFDDKANRAKLERMLNRGTFSPSAKRAILNGTPLIHVEIYHDFINVYVNN
ncbi:hypothetical protein [Aerobium aerolatum]|nr:hypothetical protein [Aquamicrobium aerolatum]